jgi:uncharacterized damage-inducible protein DinB
MVTDRLIIMMRNFKHQKTFMHKIDKPTNGFPAFYQPYMDCVPGDGALISHLTDIIRETESLLSSLSEEQLLYRYSEGKWSIKDIILHLADCERVIIYRAMRIARGDTTNLPGFDENLFVENAGADERSIENILAELKAYRNASISFIDSLNEEKLDRTGTANNFELSTRLLVNHLYGHHKHHLNILQERYLPAFQ